jgi:hypothetical protein
MSNNIVWPVENYEVYHPNHTAIALRSIMKKRHPSDIWEAELLHRVHEYVEKCISAAYQIVPLCDHNRHTSLLAWIDDRSKDVMAREAKEG